MRSRSKVAGLLLLCLLLPVWVGCRGSAGRLEFDGRYELLQPQEVPERLMEQYEKARGVWGLYQLQRGRNHYLLLAAGRTEEAAVIEIMQIQGPAEKNGDVRILARVRPGAGEEGYPFVVIRVEGARTLRFKARMALPDGQVAEVRSIRVLD